MASQYRVTWTIVGTNDCNAEAEARKLFDTLVASARSSSMAGAEESVEMKKFDTDAATHGWKTVRVYPATEKAVPIPGKA
jgi:hypothetical protein